MRIALFGVLLCGVLFGDDFINKYEYGEMLYKNPRGVSCEGCHGVFGEGKKMGSVIKNKKELNITAPDIRKVSVEQIKKSMNAKKSVMPSYFLTDLEVDAIVYYLHKANERKRIEQNATR